VSVHENITVWIDREPTLDEELSALGEEDIFEMANLGEAQTGVPGVIMITTAMGRHGPRVKYLTKPGRHQPSFSVAVASEPRAVAKSDDFDDRIFTRMAPLVMEWVRVNHEALARFWWDGTDLMTDEVQAFVADLTKI